MNPDLQASIKDGLQLHHSIDNQEQQLLADCGSGQPELAKYFGKLVAGDILAGKFIVKYYLEDRYCEPNKNEILERIIAKRCKEKLVSPLVTNEYHVTAYADILNSMLPHVPNLIKETEIQLEELGAVYNRFPNTRPHEETALQKDVSNIAEILFKSDDEKRKMAKLFCGQRFTNSGVIFYPDPIKSTSPVLWDKSLIEFEQELQQSGTKLKIKFIKIEGRDLVSKDLNGKSDPFFEVHTGDKKGNNKVLFKSSVKKKTLQPEWDMAQEKHDSFTATAGNTVYLTMYDQDLLSKEFMGVFEFEPSFVFTLHEKAVCDPLPSVTVVMKAGSKRGKNKHDFSVSGYLVITMKISKE